MNFLTADDMSAIIAVKLRKRLGFGMRAKLHITGMHVEGKVCLWNIIYSNSFGGLKSFCVINGLNFPKLSNLGLRKYNQIWSFCFVFSFFCQVLVGVKFLRTWPYLGRLRVCFAEPPYFQMTVKPIFNHGVDVTEVPGIAGWLVSVSSIFSRWFCFLLSFHLFSSLSHFFYFFIIN